MCVFDLTCRKVYKSKPLVVGLSDFLEHTVILCSTGLQIKICFVNMCSTRQLPGHCDGPERRRHPDRAGQAQTRGRPVRETLLPARGRGAAVVRSPPPPRVRSRRATPEDGQCCAPLSASTLLHATNTKAAICVAFQYIRVGREPVGPHPCTLPRRSAALPPRSAAEPGREEKVTMTAAWPRRALCPAEAAGERGAEKGQGTGPLGPGGGIDSDGGGAS